jgi:hypothetical protein
MPSCGAASDLSRFSWVVEAARPAADGVSYRRDLQDPRVPREGHLQDAMREIFAAVSLPPAMGVAGPLDEPTPPNPNPNAGSGMGEGGGSIGSSQQSPAASFAPPRCARRTCPADTLLARLALHALVLGNARAVAVLWQRFMREVRFAHWERLLPLPRMGPKKVDHCNQPPSPRPLCPGGWVPVPLPHLPGEALLFQRHSRRYRTVPHTARHGT